MGAVLGAALIWPTTCATAGTAPGSRGARRGIVARAGRPRPGRCW
jgi:hypothetical protein